MLEDLIARLEKASGPDTQLDCDILCALDDLGVAPHFYPLGYTASIDAAVALVPEGRARSLTHYRDCSTPNNVPLAQVSRVKWDERGNESEFYKSEHSRAATPALALVAAALKSRAARAGDV